MNKYSVLQNFKPTNLKLDPFPYIHIPEVLPWDLYERLEKEYPEEHVTGGTTTGFGTARYRQHEFDYANVVSDTWREFINYNTSKMFKDELIRAFRTGIVEHYNTTKGFAEDLYTKYIRADVSPRMFPKKGTIRMEMQFVANAIDNVSIRTPHVDQSKELFACLFYFKKPEDEGTDGGLNVFRNTAGKQWRRVTGREAVDEDIEVVDHIPYKRNTMACFLNTVNSLHGVTPRTDPKTIRRYINIDGHVEEKLFKFID
jgi:hypothetical protein